MYDAGVRFWYDEELTAGRDWDAEVFKKINNPHCSGVIFYISENFFGSDSIYKEILTTLGKNAKLSTPESPKNYFCINLTDNKPSILIKENFVETKECEELFENSEENLKDFLLESFRDKSTYIPYNTKNYFEKALEVNNPTPTKINLRGQSYIYGIITDSRIVK